MQKIKLGVSTINCFEIMIKRFIHTDSPTENDNNNNNNNYNNDYKIK